MLPSECLVWQSNYQKTLPVTPVHVSLQATTTIRRLSIPQWQTYHRDTYLTAVEHYCATNHRLANNFLPDLEHFIYDNSQPVTCSRTRRQAFIRRIWTVISTTYRLLCGVLHNDRHLLNYRTWNFLRRPRPPRTAGRRLALVYTDLSIILASRVMAMAGTAAWSLK